MSDIKKIIDRIADEEDLDDEDGAYPIIFKNDFYRLEFVMLLKLRRIKNKIKKICHL